MSGRFCVTLSRYGFERDRGANSDAQTRFSFIFRLSA